MNLKNLVVNGLSSLAMMSTPLIIPSGIQYQIVNQAFEKGHSKEYIKEQYERISKEGNTSEKILEFTGRPGRALAYKFNKTNSYSNDQN